MALKPVLNYQPKERQKPVLQNIEKKKWRFSFRFWRQIEYFALDRCSPSWFVSFLERLQDLSNQEIKSFISESSFIIVVGHILYVIMMDGYMLLKSRTTTFE